MDPANFEFNPAADGWVCKDIDEKLAKRNHRAIEKRIKDEQELFIAKELLKGFFGARKHKQKTFDEASFEVNLTLNLYNLVRSVLDKSYKPSRSIAFVTFIPVAREIFAAPFRDRVIHHFLFNMNAEWWNRRLIYDSYSCRKGKGTLMAVERLVKNERRITRNYTRGATIFKFDVKSFFMSLKRDKLYKRVREGLKEQYPDGGFLYKTCDFLWFQVIMDDPTIGARKRGNLDNWSPKKLPPEKSLFNQPKGQGIVIGNLTSQLLSNIFLDKLDRYITITLGYKYYGRYVDDFYVLVPEEDVLHFKKEIIPKIELFLSGIGLTLHPKKRYAQSIYKGVNFIGANVRPHCVLPSRRVKGNFEKATRLFMMDMVDEKVIVSFLGMMKHRDSYKIIKKTFEKVGWEYTETISNLKYSRVVYGPGRF